VGLWRPGPGSLVIHRWVSRDTVVGERERGEGRRKKKKKKKKEREKGKYGEMRVTDHIESEGIFYGCVKRQNKVKFKT
jgi:hypothetical protein